MRKAVWGGPWDLFWAPGLGLRNGQEIPPDAVFSSTSEISIPWTQSFRSFQKEPRENASPWSGPQAGLLLPLTPRALGRGEDKPPASCSSPERCQALATLTSRETWWPRTAARAPASRWLCSLAPPQTQPRMLLPPLPHPSAPRQHRSHLSGSH